MTMEKQSKAEQSRVAPTKLLNERLKEHKGGKHYFTVNNKWGILIAEQAAQELADEIERYYIPRPRFEDGEPVQFGDVVQSESGEADRVYIMTFYGNGSSVLRDGTPVDICELDNGELVKRPAPEVPGADGLPIVEGETVYLSADGTEGTVKSVDRDNATAYVEYSDHRWSPCVSCSVLTHTPPDSLEKLRNDLDAFMRDCEINADKVDEFSDRFTALLERGA